MRQTRLSHPLPQLRCPASIPWSSTRTLVSQPWLVPVTQGVPRWKGTCGDARTQVLTCRSRRRRYYYISMLLKTAFLQRL